MDITNVFVCVIAMENVVEYIITSWQWVNKKPAAFFLTWSQEEPL